MWRLFLPFPHYRRLRISLCPWFFFLSLFYIGMVGWLVAASCRVFRIGPTVGGGRSLSCSTTIRPLSVVFRLFSVCLTPLQLPTPHWTPQPPPPVSPPFF